MRQLHAARIAGRVGQVEAERLAGLQLGGPVPELPDPQFRSLQVDQDADRPVHLHLDLADQLVALAHLVVAAVAHVQPEHVDTGDEQLLQHFARGTGRPDCGDDLGAAFAAHGGSSGCKPARIIAILPGRCNRWVVNNVATLRDVPADYMAVPMRDDAPFQPYECIPGQGDTILVCDHASNAVPPEIGGLGVPSADMERHIAYDIGARAVTLRLAAAMGAPAVLSTFSRLVIDPNRGEWDPTLIMKIYDGSVIQGNRRVGPEERARRIAAYHRPYREVLGRAIDERVAAGGAPVLVSIHSFTPQLRGHLPRPWHLGLLWDHDDRLFRPLMGRLRAHPDLVIGDNQPYSGSLPGDTMWTYGVRRGLAHILIEVRNDLIATAAGQAEWADLLAPAVRGAVADMFATGDAGPRPVDMTEKEPVP